MGFGQSVERRRVKLRFPRGRRRSAHRRPACWPARPCRTSHSPTTTDATFSMASTKCRLDGGQVFANTSGVARNYTSLCVPAGKNLSPNRIAGPPVCMTDLSVLLDATQHCGDRGCVCAPPQTLSEGSLTTLPNLVLSYFLPI